MTTFSRRLALALPPALAALPALANPHAVALGPLHIEQPWTRAAAQGAQGAGYMVIRNAGGTADRLVAASSPAAPRVELHTHIRDGDVMRMREVPAIEIPANGAATLQPGGLHLMFIGLVRPLAQGETVPVTLRFERAGEVTVSLRVEAAGARGATQHRH